MGSFFSYDSFSDALDEAGWARIYGGIHYRSAVEASKVMGREVGRTVNELQLKQ